MKGPQPKKRVINKLVKFLKNRKQPAEVLHRKGVRKNFKKRLQHKCFLVKFAKMLRTPSLQNTSRRLLTLNSLMLLICYLIRRTFIRNRCITSDSVYQKDCARHLIFSVRSVKSIFIVVLFADIG